MPSTNTPGLLNGQTGQNKVSGQGPLRPVASFNNWSVGQLLKATVLEQLANNTLLLSLGKSKISAHTSLPLETGSQLQLKVLRTGDQPLLQVLSQSRHAASNAEISAAALRQALPRQAPLADFFTSIRHVSYNDTRLPQSIQQVLQALQASIASRAEIQNPEGVKKAMNGSGLFLESNLHSQRGPAFTNTDLKAQLLRLADRLTSSNTSLSHNVNKPIQQPVQANSSPAFMASVINQMDMPELQRQVESALARIQLNQLNSIPNSEQNSQPFVIELPIKDADQTDVVAIKINQEEARKQDRDSNQLWSVMLSFELHELGHLHARLTLGGEKIRASLWAEQNHTFTLLQHNLDYLRERLKEVEFFDPEVHCFKGKPETLLDERTNYNELVNVEI